MVQFQFIASTPETLVHTGGVEMPSFSDAVTTVSDFMRDNGTPFEHGHSLLLGVAGFPPVHMQCSGQTTLDNGKVIPTWKLFSQQ
jgi:hypothetical protein